MARSTCWSDDITNARIRHTRPTNDWRNGRVCLGQRRKAHCCARCDERALVRRAGVVRGALPTTLSGGPIRTMLGYITTTWARPAIVPESRASERRKPSTARAERFSPRRCRGTYGRALFVHGWTRRSSLWSGLVRTRRSCLRHQRPEPLRLSHRARQGARLRSR